jgi:hypothetical protein
MTEEIENNTVDQSPEDIGFEPPTREEEEAEAQPEAPAIEKAIQDRKDAEPAIAAKDKMVLIAEAQTMLDYLVTQPSTTDNRTHRRVMSDIISYLQGE